MRASTSIVLLGMISIALFFDFQQPQSQATSLRLSNDSEQRVAAKTNPRKPKGHPQRGSGRREFLQYQDSPIQQS